MSNSLNDNQIKLLKAISGGISSNNLEQQISTLVNLSIDLVVYYLDNLEQEGLIEGTKKLELDRKCCFLDVWLTKKGKVAINYPDDLIQEKSPNQNIYTEGGDYREINTNGGRYIENTGTYYENFNQSQSLTDAAAEIQKLLQQLSQTYPTNTTTEKMAIAIKAIEQIESDSTLTQRILSAFKAGGVSALESSLNHPAASFVIGALEDWQQTKHRGN